MTIYCVDISGSVSDKQIVSAMDLLLDKWIHGDSTIVFDYRESHSIDFNDIIDYAFGKDVGILQMILFKKAAKSKWIGRSGAYKAVNQSLVYSSKNTCVALTDGLLSEEDLKIFDHIVKI